MPHNKKTEQSKPHNPHARKPRPLPPKKKPTHPEITPLLTTVLNLDKEYTNHLDRQILTRRTSRRTARQLHLQRKEQARNTRQLLRRARQRGMMRLRHQQMMRSRSYRRRRHRKLKYDRLSRDQILDERDAVRRAAWKRGELNVKQGENTYDPLVQRLRKLNEEMRELWRDHGQGIVDSEPRYLEGWPVRETLGPPMVLSTRRWMRRGDGLSCLQCQRKGMLCSRPYWRWKRGGADWEDPVRACTRCVRNGKRFECLTRVEEKVQGEKGEKVVTRYVLAENDADEGEREKEGLGTQEDLDERVAVVLDGLRRERKGLVTDVIGSGMQDVRKSKFALPPKPHDKRLKKVW